MHGNDSGQAKPGFLAQLWPSHHHLWVIGLLLLASPCFGVACCECAKACALSPLKVFCYVQSLQRTGAPGRYLGSGSCSRRELGGSSPIYNGVDTNVFQDGGLLGFDSMGPFDASAAGGRRTTHAVTNNERGERTLSATVSIVEAWGGL